jgi:DNA-binding NtrC family response regulator
MSETQQTILIVDDEAPVLRLMSMLLTRHGYNVEACEDPVSALTLFRKHPDRFDLLIADLTLPGMKGDEMALQMAKSKPDLLVLLCSGYPFEVSTLPAEHQPRFSVLQKPFLPAMLMDSIKQLLARSHA